MDAAHFQIWFFLLIIALGFVGGFLSGMLGVGGGIIFVPIIQEIVRYHDRVEDKVPYVLANSLLIVFVVGIAGSIKQYTMKNTDIRSALATGIAAIVSSLSLTIILRYYNINDPKLFSGLFAAVLVITAIRMWFDRKNSKSTGEMPVVLPGIKKFLPAGFMAGIISSVTGLGGGVVLVPYFNRALRLPIKFSTGLSLTVIPIIALPMLLFYMFSNPLSDLYPGWQTGHILWPAVIPLILSAAIASPFGVKAAHALNSYTLFKIYLVFIIINIVKVLLYH